ncbi:MAG: hypothetical protein E6344_14120 [Clostridium sp.]|nr:hypothetical protein [Clostridium sp.]MDU7084828.1 hypothetical protein [Clostridium sp.]
MDSILSVRINEEVKEKFIKLAEEQGVNNKEFLDLIIKSYEMNKVTADVDFVRNDIEELQAIVKRVVDIYINIIDKSKLRTTELINNFNLSIGEEKEKTEGFTLEISNMKKQLEELKSENKDLKNSGKELQVALSKEKEAIKESRDMNSILKEKLTDFNRYKEENENLKKNATASEKELAAFQSEFYDIKQELEKYISENQQLKDKINEIIKSNHLHVEELKSSYEGQLKMKENELSLKLQQEILQKEQGLRQEIWDLKAKYDEKISSLIKEKEELLFKISKIQDK